MENLRYAKLSAIYQEIFAACRAVAIHEKILGFTDGYNSKVGEQGVKLSGGERQCMAIARVLSKDPPILILDEATSAVDMSTESEILLALDMLKTKLLDEGRIVERGMHQELLELGGRYKSLWIKQVGGYSESQN
ncbi:P-loop containing nucleoside triphosphate hydrolase protein [Cadophora sp. DSE1049]|nr:P-loop containing nucleoside triphosphate hydrolase protein [Cadophora sp. DSE1049]